MRIMSRAAWGAQPWSGEVHEIEAQARREFVVHYHGAPPAHPVGPAMARDVDQIHRDRGWSGVGYNFLIDQEGVVFEGRGWDLVGAHCPGHNRIGLGVYFAVGGDQQPTTAALASGRALYELACRRTGRPLRRTWHGANYPTDCPGRHLVAWVVASMPAPTPTEGDDMALSDQDIGRLLDAAARHDGLLNAIADRLLSGRPSEDGGARYKVKDVDGDGGQELIGLTEASTRQLSLLRHLAGQ